MNLDQLGYNSKLEAYRQAHQLTNIGVAQVIAEHKERYLVQNSNP